MSMEEHFKKCKQTFKTLIFPIFLILLIYYANMLLNLSSKILKPNLSYVQVQPVRYKFNRLRTKYLRKAQITRVDPDGTYHVEGVSNKVNPIPVLWKEPAQLSRVNPGEDGSGDLDGLPDVDITRPPVELEQSTLWAKATPEVRRILSLEFGRNKDRVNVIRSDLLKKIQEHQLDTNSVPYIIASMTVSIRNMQRDLAERGPHENRMLKHCLKIKVDHRRSLLKLLREQDYKKFEWLLEKLNIVYKPRPFEFEPIKRFVLQERLVDLWCDELKHFKLQCYKEKLESEQPTFLREKAEKLRWIMESEKELGLEQTVNQSEIDQCLERAKSIEDRSKSQSSEWPYYILEKEEKNEGDVFIS